MKTLRLCIAYYLLGVASVLALTSMFTFITNLAKYLTGYENVLSDRFGAHGGWLLLAGAVAAVVVARVVDPTPLQRNRWGGAK